MLIKGTKTLNAFKVVSSLWKVTSSYKREKYYIAGLFRAMVMNFKIALSRMTFLRDIISFLSFKTFAHLPLSERQIFKKLNDCLVLTIFLSFFKPTLNQLR